MNDILFGNNNRKIIKKLANRNIQADRRSNLLLIVTIAVSVCMVFAILLASTGLDQQYKNTQKDKAQISVIGATDEQLSALRQSQDVMWVGEYSLLGFSYQDNITLTLAYADTDYLQNQMQVSFEGKLPEGSDEVMLPQNYIDFLGIPYQVGDIVSLDITGTGTEASYTISGILNVTGKSNGYYVYISEELAKELAGDTFQISAYTRLNSEITNSNDILNLAYSAIQGTGIVEEQINLTDYFAVMTGVIKPGLSIPVPFLALITAFLAAFVIYGIFYTMITKNVQTLGQLRTIGMTRKQIKKMAKRQGYLFAVKGIPLGLITGAMIGFIISPGGFRITTTLIYAVIVAMVSFLILIVAINKPVRIAMNTSPLEGSKYLAYSGKIKSSHKLHRKLTPFNLALINISRNKKKGAFILLTLGLSGALLLATANVAGSIDAEKKARFRYFPYGDIQVSIQNIARSTFSSDTESFRSTRLQLEDNPLENQELIRQLEAIDGVEKVISSNCVMLMITFPADMGSITSVTNFVPTLDEEQIQDIKKILINGTADYVEMTENIGILTDENIADVGDTLTLEGRSNDGGEFSIDAVVVGTYNSADLMEEYPVVPGSPYFLITYDTAKKLTGVTDQTGMLSISTTADNYDAVSSIIQGIVDESDEIDCYLIEQTINNIQRNYNQSIQILYLVAVILFVFGGISLANTLLVDFRNRKREFGLLETVGATQRQLKRMLHTEVFLYLSGTFVISIVGGTVAGAIVCNNIDQSSHCIDYSFPWLFLLGLIAMLFVIQILFSLYTSHELKNTKMLDAIRA